MIDKQGKITELTPDPDGVFAGDFQGGDYRTAFWGSETYKAIVFARVLDGVVNPRTFVERERNNAALLLLKETMGTFMLSEKKDCILYYQIKLIHSYPISELWKNKKKTIDCGGYSSTCGIHFMMV